MSTHSDFEIIIRRAINPGIEELFPWLSNQAGGWESYKFNKLHFSYVPRCSTGTPGSIMMAIDYDPVDSNPVTEEIMSTYASAKETSVWNSVTTTADPRAMNAATKTKFIRTAFRAPGTDRHLYDSGTFLLSMADGPTTDIGAGKIWAEYDVTFYDQASRPNGNNTYALIYGNGTVSSSAIWGSAPQSAGNASFAAQPNSNALFITGVEPNTYISLKVTIYGTGITAFNLTRSTGTVTAQNYNVAALAGAGQVEACLWYWFFVGPGGNIVLDFAVTATTIDQDCVAEMAVVPYYMNDFIAAYINPVDAITNSNCPTYKEHNRRHPPLPIQQTTKRLSKCPRTLDTDLSSNLATLSISYKEKEEEADDDEPDENDEPELKWVEHPNVKIVNEYPKLPSSQIPQNYTPNPLKKYPLSGKAPTA